MPSKSESILTAVRSIPISNLLIAAQKEMVSCRWVVHRLFQALHLCAPKWTINGIQDTEEFQCVFFKQLVRVQALAKLFSDLSVIVYYKLSLFPFNLFTSINLWTQTCSEQFTVAVVIRYTACMAFF